MLSPSSLSLQGGASDTSLCNAGNVHSADGRRDVLRIAAPSGWGRRLKDPAIWAGAALQRGTEQAAIKKFLVKRFGQRLPLAPPMETQELSGGISSDTDK
jgi:hypothetical protein